MAFITDELLDKAAAIRAQGLSWVSAAHAVHRTADRVQRWPKFYPERWVAAMKRAEGEVLKSATAESLNALRLQLRDEDVKHRQAAATALLRHQSGRKPSKKKSVGASAGAIRMAQYVEGLSDGEVDQILRELDAAPEAPPTAESHAPAEPDGPPLPERSECVF